MITSHGKAQGIIIPKHQSFWLYSHSSLTTVGGQQLHLSVDVLALGSMKTAARRDIQWELQKHGLIRSSNALAGQVCLCPAVVECRL